MANHLAQLLLNKVLPHAVFFQQFLSRPAQTGSICPSGRHLARTLVAEALLGRGKGIIIDLGAGSGPISRELLKSGFPAKKILAVDLSDRCADVFQRDCPGVRLCIADARNLRKIVGREFPNVRVRAIISSLPLRVMPARVIVDIMSEAISLLSAGGVYVQYTYALWHLSALTRYGFSTHRRTFVPLNVPPALVETYWPEGVGHD